MGGDAIAKMFDTTKINGHISANDILKHASSPDIEFGYHISAINILKQASSPDISYKFILGFLFDLIEKRLVFELSEKPSKFIPDFFRSIPPSYKSKLFLNDIKHKIQDLLALFPPSMGSGDGYLGSYSEIFGIKGPEYINHEIAGVILKTLGGYIESDSA